jgi:hypothetical protein
LRWWHPEPGSVRRRVAWALYRHPMDTADSPGAAHDDGTREIALALAAAPHPPQPLPRGAARRRTAHARARH